MNVQLDSGAYMPDRALEKGDKIAQLVVMFILNPEIEMHQVAQVEARERGNNGFGSTGK